MQSSSSAMPPMKSRHLSLPPLLLLLLVLLLLLLGMEAWEARLREGQLEEELGSIREKAQGRKKEKVCLVKQKFALFKFVFFFLRFHFFFLFSSLSLSLSTSLRGPTRRARRGGRSSGLARHEARESLVDVQPPVIFSSSSSVALPDPPQHLSKLGALRQPRLDRRGSSRSRGGTRRRRRRGSITQRRREPLRGRQQRLDPI